MYKNKNCEIVFNFNCIIMRIPTLHITIMILKYLCLKQGYYKNKQPKKGSINQGVTTTSLFANHSSRTKVKRHYENLMNIKFFGLIVAT